MFVPVSSLRHLRFACSGDVYSSILAGVPGYAAECRRVRGDLVGAARDTDLWDFCGARQACGWRHADLIGPRQQAAMPRVLKPGHLISSRRPAKGAPGARRRDHSPRLPQLKWDFCGACRRLPKAHVVGHSETLAPASKGQPRGWARVVGPQLTAPGYLGSRPLISGKGVTGTVSWPGACRIV